MSDYETIAKAPWHDAAATKFAAGMVRAYLRDIPEKDTMSTSALLRGMGAPVETHDGMARHIGQARRSGMLEDCFILGLPNRGTFGKPSILWHGCQGAMSPEELAANLQAYEKRRLAYEAEQSQKGD